MAEEKDADESIENSVQGEESVDEADESGAAESAEEAEGEAAEQAKEKKKKKVVRRRKSKKDRENVLTAAVRLTVESGKVEFGSRAGLSEKSGKAKLYVVADNAPAAIRGRVEAAAKKAKIPVIEFEGSTMELGSVCGKPFPVSVLSVYEEGSSSIMDLAKKK